MQNAHEVSVGCYGPSHPSMTAPAGQREKPRKRHLAKEDERGQSYAMFTIEHEFDATVITLVDEGEAPLQEDVTINSFAECVTLEQLDPRGGAVQKITLSPEQLRDLAAALDLPEGIYQLREVPPE